MLVYGGQTKDGADQSLWQFNVTMLRWTKVNKISSWSYQMIKGILRFFYCNSQTRPCLRRTCISCTKFAVLFPSNLSVNSCQIEIKPQFNRWIKDWFQIVEFECQITMFFFVFVPQELT